MNRKFKSGEDLAKAEELADWIKRSLDDALWDHSPNDAIWSINLIYEYTDELKELLEGEDEDNGNQE